MFLNKPSFSIRFESENCRTCRSERAKGKAIILYLKIEEPRSMPQNSGNERRRLVTRTHRCPHHNSLGGFFSDLTVLSSGKPVVIIRGDKRRPCREKGQVPLQRLEDLPRRLARAVICNRSASPAGHIEPFRTRATR